MKSILISICIFLSSCSLQEKQSIVYTSTWKQESDSAVMSKCKGEAIKITWLMFEAHGNTWSVEDVMRVEHFVFVSCLQYNNMFI